MKALIIAERPELVAPLSSVAREAGADQVITAVLPDGGAPQSVPEVAYSHYVVTSSSPRPEDRVSAVVELMTTVAADAVFLAATISGRELAPRAAVRCDSAYIPEAESIVLTAEGGTAQRVVHAGGAIEDLAWEGASILTVSVRPASPEEVVGAPEVVTDTSTHRVTRRTLNPLPAREEDIASADRIVCMGMGVAQQADVAGIEELARAFEASVACTRPIAEDRHWLSADRYIGISGLHLSPTVYLGLGVSGQVQHAVGMRGSKVVVEVNTDAEAPSMSEADHIVIADVAEFVPALTAALKARH